MESPVTPREPDEPEARSRLALDWFIARHYLSARRGGRLLSLITGIALAGITVGVCALVVVTGVMAGMQKELKERILSSTAHVSVYEQGSVLRMRDWRPVLDSARALPGVRAASPFIFSSITLLWGGNSRSVDLYGVPVDPELAGGTTLEEEILAGAYDLSPRASGLPPILLGSGVAERLEIEVGDTLPVLAYENVQESSFSGLQPAFGQFEVSGTFHTGMYDYDTKNVYTTLEAAQGLLDLDVDDVVSGLGIQLDDPDAATALAAELDARLGFPYVVMSWAENNRGLFGSLRLQKLAMGVILFLIVVVAAFNIVSTLVMMVADRTREIGILKSMGMTDAGILRVFVLQGAWIGVVGTLAGTVLGLAVAWGLDFWGYRIPGEIYFVEELPVSVRLGDVAVIVAASVAVAFLATLYPALQASRLQPVDAIRNE